MTPDPSKYREAHRRFKEVLLNYTPDVVPKSIDEFVLNLSDTPKVQSGMTMEEIGYEIKEKIYESLGEAVTVNVGIAPNRFLAKYAAGFNKPNGLTTIDHTNLEDRYRDMDLVDLPGINTRYRGRLQIMGIKTPLDFLNADPEMLQKNVFRSIVGYHWHMRLRGWEIDAREFPTRSIGHQYALSHKTADREELARLLMKLCEKTGRRLRKSSFYASGIHLYMGFVSSPNDGHLGFDTMRRLRSWHKGTKVGYRLYGTQEIYEAASALLNQAEIYNKVSIMSVHVYGLEPWDPEQMNIFDDNRALSTQKRLSDAMDEVNSRYGEFVLTPATMMDMQGTVLDRIAFGGTKDMSQL